MRLGLRLRPGPRPGLMPGWGYGGRLLRGRLEQHEQRAALRLGERHVCHTAAYK